MLNCSIGSIIRGASLRSAGHAGALHSIQACRLSTAVSVLSHARRSYHIDHAGYEAEQEEHDKSPRRSRQQTVEPPANHRSNHNACNQLGRKPETARHCRGSGSAISASGSELVSPDLSAAPNFGQPLIQTSEPCGKRGFVRRRLVATAISAVVRAFSHAVETRNKWCG